MPTKTGGENGVQKVKKWWIKSEKNDKLSDVLTNAQKYNKITYFLTSLKKEGKIKLGKQKRWILC